MKRKIFIVLCLVFIFLLTACEGKSNNESISTTAILNENEATPTVSDIKDDQITINPVLIPNDIRITAMKAAGVAHPLLFDVYHNGDVKEISIWIDKYEHGQFVEEISGITAYTADSENTASIYVSQRKSEIDIIDWTLSIQQGNSLSSGHFTTEQSLYSAMGTSTLQDKSTKLNTDTILGYIVFHNKSSWTVHQDEESNIKDHDLVFIIKCKFI